MTMAEKTKKRKRNTSDHQSTPSSKRLVTERLSADISVNVLSPASGAPNVIVGKVPLWMLFFKKTKTSTLQYEPRLSFL